MKDQIRLTSSSEQDGQPQAFPGIPLLVGSVLLIAVLSFWIRSLWESRDLFRPDCRSAPTIECVEDLRRAASWDSPFNFAAKQAFRDLEALSAGTYPERARAAEALGRARATTRSIFDPNSVKLAVDLIPGFALLAFVAFCGWIFGIWLMVQRGFRADGTVEWGELRRAALRMIAFFVIWFFALTNA